MKPDRQVVGIAEGRVTRGDGELATYALGSCIGVCLYDRPRHIAGLVHILLPSRALVVERTNPYKFADSGIEELIRTMERLGAVRAAITAKLVGGAQMFQVDSGQRGVGERNIDAARQALQEQGIPILAQDVGKTHGRSICFSARTGMVHVKTVRMGEHVL